LPRAKYKDYSANPVMDIFVGRISLQFAAAYFTFSKGSKYQKLLHHLKYYDRPELGEYAGMAFGNELQETCFEDIDMIIPVPLHKNKLHVRGYNQSELIAKGIGARINKPVCTGILYRNVDTGTQTQKSRYERWQNMEGVFRLRTNVSLQNKHILLVDDVLTTGATLEASAIPILANNTTTISIAVLSIA
jgi:ComF family protein